MICVDLQGMWDLYLDEKKEYTKPPKGNDCISLPDSTAHAGKGKENKEPNPSYMAERYPFEGYAWYSREIELKSEYVDKNIVLFLERTRISTVYLDGTELDTQNSLCGFHKHDLTGCVTEGKHILTVRVDNTDYPTKGGHMTSPDTQTNWNGILGKIELQIRDKEYPDNLQVYAKTPEKIRICASIHEEKEQIGATNADVKTAVIIIRRKGGINDGELLYEGVRGYEGNRLETYISLEGDNLLWDEYETNLLEAIVTVGTECASTVFGIRDLSHEGRKLLVNQKQVFWRGKHDGMVFPYTGYAPMTVTEWKKVLSTAKEYGINHYRFHTCCPPDAAFTAADELGIYMEPELPFWGTIGAPGEEQYNGPEQEYLIKEGFRILGDFGNHPSFAMLSMGNELWGNTERINGFLKAYKEADDRHLYTQGSNNFQFCPVILEEEDVFCGVRLAQDRLFRGSYAMCDAPQGHIQTKEPTTYHSYDEVIVPPECKETEKEAAEIEIQYGTGTKKVQAVQGAGGLIPQVPMISHEIGQYDFFPDFDELRKYKGSQQPLYLEIYKQRMQATGIFEQWKDFFEASGKLAIDCYKRELEAAFTTTQLSGFQLLDLQDFPGQCVALVGVLNAWMESKGLISPKEWRGFCNDVVILALIESFVLQGGESVSIPLKLSVCNPAFAEGKTVAYKVETENETIIEGQIEIPRILDRVTGLGNVEFFIPDYGTAEKLTLRFWIPETEYENRYSIWVYPQENVEITENKISFCGREVSIVKNLEAALDLQKAGKAVLCIPEVSENSIEGTYCTDFWNYPMFRSISESMGRKVPVGTLGLYIHENEYLQKEFLTENHSTPQWYHLVMHSHCEVLDHKENVKLLVQPIDNIERCHKLGMLYYEHGVLVCTSRIYEITEKPEVRAFAKILLELCY